MKCDAPRCAICWRQPKANTPKGRSNNCQGAKVSSLLRATALAVVVTCLRPVPWLSPRRPHPAGTIFRAALLRRPISVACGKLIPSHCDIAGVGRLRRLFRAFLGCAQLAPMSSVTFARPRVRSLLIRGSVTALFACPLRPTPAACRANYRRCRRCTETLAPSVFIPRRSADLLLAPLSLQKNLGLGSSAFASAKMVPRAPTGGLVLHADGRWSLAG